MISVSISDSFTMCAVNLHSYFAVIVWSGIVVVKYMHLFFTPLNILKVLLLIFKAPYFTLSVNMYLRTCRPLHMWAACTLEGIPRV